VPGGSRMLVIGIDPGTARTGYGIVRMGEDDALHLVDYGVITTAANQALAQRLQRLYIALRELLAQYEPACAAVEKLFYQRNVSTAMAVGQARGVSLLALAEAGMEVREYTPRVVKQAVAGYGGAEKRQVQEMVRLLLGMDHIPHPDDAADALALAICDLHSQTMLRRLEEES
jgi:crossover junction endodeoxyribonuclease RuvC